jgi:ApaG protein
MGVTQHSIDIDVATQFLDDQSAPDEDRYAFAYTIRIRNAGEVPARLMTPALADHRCQRQGAGSARRRRGRRTALAAPGEQFEYTSGAVLETNVGTMRGSYA